MFEFRARVKMIQRRITKNSVTQPLKKKKPQKLLARLICKELSWVALLSPYRISLQ